MNLLDQFGNMMLILFAGHDTTGHTMTWLTYELARHPHLQKRLQAEARARRTMLERPLIPFLSALQHSIAGNRQLSLGDVAWSRTRRNDCGRRSL